jgi:putative transcriptional regulator
MENRKLRKLIALRAELGLTQAAMASLLGMSPTTYAAKEKGQSPFTVPEALKILRLFNVKFEDIFLPSSYGSSVAEVRRIPGTEHGFEVDIKEG